MNFPQNFFDPLADVYGFDFPKQAISPEDEFNGAPEFLCDYLLDMKIPRKTKNHPLDILAEQHGGRA